MSVQTIITDKRKLSEVCIETTIDQARTVIHDLMDTAHYHKKNCAGLAANQIGSNLRVFVVKVRGKFVAFVNPKFKPVGAKVDSVEGCLSFPGKKTRVKRYSSIIATPYRKSKYITLSGISAIAFQHELDHLNGKTI